MRLWTEEYRPHNLDDVILPNSVRKTCQDAIDSGSLQNMLFFGGPGIGKTTVAKAMCDQLGVTPLVINGSDDSGIETLRQTVRRYASTENIMGGDNVVIYDEADALTRQTQEALRGFIEEFADSCRFIFTCNYPHKLIAPLRDRLVPVDFNIPKSDVDALTAKMGGKLFQMLDAEGVEYDRRVVAQYVINKAPNWRSIIVGLNSYALGGKIDTGILSALDDTEVKRFVDHIKSGRMEEMLSYLMSAPEIDYTEMRRSLYLNAYKYCDKAYVPGMIMILNSWQLNEAQVADPLLAAQAAAVELSKTLKWKDT